jgi:hypothetical protein
MTTRSQDAYIAGWNDASEFLINTLHKASNNPKTNSCLAGREIATMLREIAELFEQHTQKMVDTLCKHTDSDPRSLN